jgi:hypothetical protein
MQINVGSLTGSTPKFLLLHLEPITHMNWPQTYVTQTFHTYALVIYAYYMRNDQLWTYN